MTNYIISREEPEDPYGSIPGDREWLRQHVPLPFRRVLKVACDQCGASSSLYRRPINRGEVKSLVDMYMAAGTNWQMITNNERREEAKLPWWGLAEKGKVRGEYRVTLKAVQWLRGDLRIPYYAVSFGGRLISLEGKLISPWEVYPFDYGRLMRGE